MGECQKVVDLVGCHEQTGLFVVGQQGDGEWREGVAVKTNRQSHSLTAVVRVSCTGLVEHTVALSL